MAARGAGPGEGVTAGGDDALLAELGRMSLADLEAGIAVAERHHWPLSRFVREAWHVLEPTTPLVWGWHMDAICDHVEALLAGWAASQSGGAPPDQRNGGFCVPPGSSKSLIVSVFAPAWLWLRMPSARINVIAGNPRLAIRDSVKTRDLVRSDWYQQAFQPRWQLKEDQDTKTKFATTAGGFRAAFGAGGRITGDRSDVMVWDDLLDAADRHSTVARDLINDWIDAAAYNRVNDEQRSIRILISQRLHVDDPVGHLQQKHPGTWSWLVIPQEWEETQRTRTWLGWTDPRRVDGELMCAERWPPSVLDEARRTLGGVGYAAQHQQRPAPQEGGIFKRAWFKRFGAPPSTLDFTIHSWDPRNSRTDREGTSYVAGVCIGVKGADRYILDVRRGRWSPLETEQRAEDAYHSWVDRFGPCRALLMEEKASGPAAIESMRRRIPAVLGVLPRGSKEERASWVSPAAEAGNVWIPEVGAWVDTWLDEVCSFPHHPHEDQVDALTQGLQWLQGSSASLTQWTPTRPLPHAGHRRPESARGPRPEGGSRWRLS